MKAQLTLTFSALCMLGACDPAAYQMSDGKTVKFSAAEEKLNTGEKLAQRRLATGFFVTDNGYVVSNYHVIQGASLIHITAADGRRVRAEVVDSNPDIDIVLLKANINGRAVKIGTQSAVAKGEGVLTLGYPLMVIQGSEQKATFGRINAFSGIRSDPSVYQIDVPVQPGNSGGPLISENGVVIGVIKATFNQMAALETIGTITQNVNYAVKSDTLLPMLHKNLGNQIRMGNSTKNRHEMPALITKYERSVVLVEAE